MGEPGTVYRIIESQNTLAWPNGFKCSTETQQWYFTWMDRNETCAISEGDFVLLLPSEIDPRSPGTREWVWQFYHFGYQRKFTVYPGDIWWGCFGSFMENLGVDDTKKVE